MFGSWRQHLMVAICIQQMVFYRRSSFNLERHVAEGESMITERSEFQKKCCDSDNGNISLWKRSCLTNTKWMNGCLRIWPLCFVRSVLTDRLQLANSWKLEPLPVHVVSGLVSILIIWTLPCLSYCASIFTEAFLRFALEVWDGLTCWVGTGITLLP